MYNASAIVVSCFNPHNRILYGCSACKQYGFLFCTVILPVFHTKEHRPGEHHIYVLPPSNRVPVQPVLYTLKGFDSLGLSVVLLFDLTGVVVVPCAAAGVVMPGVVVVPGAAGVEVVPGAIVVAGAVSVEVVCGVEVVTGAELVVLSAVGFVVMPRVVVMPGVAVVPGSVGVPCCFSCSRRL